MNAFLRTAGTELMTITPELAKQMLTANVANRDIRWWWVSALSDAIKRGEFEATHQGIAFDDMGRLADGQHRLYAVIESGVSIPMMVSFGLPQSAVKLIDQGIKRTVSDILLVDKRVADPMRLATCLVRGHNRCSTAQVEAICSGGLRDTLEDLVNHSGRARRFFSSAPMKLAAAVRIMDGESQDFVLSQYAAMVSFDFDAASPAAKALMKSVGHQNFVVERKDALARGLRVFDRSRMDALRIIIHKHDMEAAVEYAKTVIRRSIGELDSTRTAHRGKKKVVDRRIPPQSKTENLVLHVRGEF